jgi:hypothetical protein
MSDLAAVGVEHAGDGVDLGGLQRLLELPREL